MSRKIGVLTFHRCINYGSYWQARCLVEGLRSLGADAVLLDHTSRRVDRAEWRCALEPLLPAKTPRSDHPLYAAKIRKFFDAFEALPLSRPFELEKPDDMEEFDGVIVGSDEVWNLRHPWYGGAALFFGQGLNTRQITAYAASFGNCRLSDGLDDYWGARLRDFAAISVRDLNSQRIIRNVLGVDAALVLDPCLKFPRVTREAGAETEGASYVVVYGHSFPAWFQQGIRRWADRRNYPVVSIGYRNDWADRQWIDAGPEDFARLLAGAAAVATNFFHGCVFSLIYRKPFACVLSDYRANKLRDLAATVGAERHLVDEGAPHACYEALLEEPLEAAVCGRIAALRHDSGVYLSHVLR